VIIVRLDGLTVNRVLITMSGTLPAFSWYAYYEPMIHRSQSEPNRAEGDTGQYCSDVHISPHARLLYLVLGWGFFGLGAVGAAIPGLPTTPFMLLALWAFSKSSRRFHRWLYAHPVFGPPLQQWCTHRVIPLKAKWLSLITMTLSFFYLAFFTAISIWIKILIAALMLYGAAFILTKPSRAPESKFETDESANPGH